MARLVTVSTSTSNGLGPNGGQVVPMDIHTDNNIHVGVAPVSGAPAVNVQYAFQNPLESGAVPANFAWFPVAALTSVSATLAALVTAPVHALRIVQNEVGDSRIFILQGSLTH